MPSKAQGFRTGLFLASLSLATAILGASLSQEKQMAFAFAQFDEVPGGPFF